MNIENVKIAGEIVGSIAGSGTVGIIIGQLIPEGLSTIKKVEVLIGTGLLGGIAGAACGKYMRKQIETVGNFIEDIKDIKNENVNN